VDLAEHGTPSTDPLRVVQGLAQAIGFIAAGVIFVARGNVRNVTSAATIWLAATLGIAAGAGQNELLAVATLLGILLVTIIRIAERYLPDSSKEG
jgi:putative Mg2+ transporter-C (MgtC) family protein